MTSTKLRLAAAAAAAFLTAAALLVTSPDRPAHAATPAGGLIAIEGVTLRTDLEAIYTARPDGSGLRQVPLPAELLPHMVALSPDGKQIAFDAGNLFVVGTDGHGLRQLTSNALNVDGPETWSPDGQWIAFCAIGPTSPDGSETVFAVRPDGTGLHQVLAGYDVTSLTWGPGGLLAISTAPESAAGHWPPSRISIRTVAMNGHDARLVPGSIRLLGSWSSVATVAGWSPGDRSLLIYNAPRAGDLSILPAGGGRPRVLLHCPVLTCTAAHYLSDLALSPDGSTVMFAVNPNDPTGNTPVLFYTVRTAGGRVTQLPRLSIMRVVTGLSW